MTEIILTGIEQQNHAIDTIRQILPNGKYCVRIEEVSEKRRDKQNRLSHAWYPQIGKHTGAGTIYERSLCKLIYGIPILRARTGNTKEGNRAADLYEKYISMYNFEAQMELIEDFPVTRAMSVKQFAEYLRTVQQESASKYGVQLIVLAEYDGAI